MKASVPETRDVVLIGGGHSHALFLRMWGMKPLAGARLTVIDPTAKAAYSGMLPGYVAGHYTRDELDIDLVRLARFAGARLILGPATGIDRERRRIIVPGHPDVPYDVASIDIGITSDLPNLPGFAEFGIPAKPLGPFATRWAARVAQDDETPVAVIGGGVAGAELAMAMAHRLRERNTPVHLIDRSVALEEVPETVRARLKEAMQKQGVTLHEHSPVSEVMAEAVRLEDGREIATEFTVGAAGAKSYGWLAETGLEHENGFVMIGPSLQTSDPAIFACGDCAEMRETPRPKAGVYAVRQAPVLYENITRLLRDQPLKPYKPQSDYLKLISLGEKSAIAVKYGRSRSGKSLWRWKDQIDQKFMARLRDLPPMEAELEPFRVAEKAQRQILCTGCGAKVGRAALEEAIHATLGSGGGIGDDAAVVDVGGVQLVQTVDHLSAVVNDPYVMARIAAVHALGDIWAMGATPETVLLSLVIPEQSASLQARTATDILTGIQEIVAPTGAQIVGGHTTMGERLSIGLSVTAAAPERPITLAGARPGDKLILAEPIGSGVLLVGDMQLRADGDDIVALLARMQQPQAQAAEILQDAHAMTDVTGFGLAGHLNAICRASDVGAVVNWPQVPCYAGAKALAEAGVTSSLFEANRADSGFVLGAETADSALFFDPQTAGGLLAAVSTDSAATCVAELRANGFSDAAIIGEIVAGPVQITLMQ